jgi:hypothetical protein
MTEYGKIHTDGSRSGGQLLHCPNCEATEQKLHDFRQKVSDEVSALLDRFLGDMLSQGVINGHMHRFIIPKPKPDPLVEQVLKNMDVVMERLEAFRAALEALGLEIREKGQ